MPYRLHELIKGLPEELVQLRAHLIRNHWTIRGAAEHLGVTYQFTSKVLGGYNTSAPLKKKLAALGPCPLHLRAYYRKFPHLLPKEARPKTKTKKTA